MSHPASLVRRLSAAIGLALILLVPAGLPAQAATATPARQVSVTAVKPTCTITGCTAALNAYNTWAGYGLPGQRGWYSWPNGQCNFAGGTYRNSNGQLPTGDSFQEYDVYPRACGARRDAYRIVVDLNSGQVWYSPDHYTTFLEIV